MKYKIENLKLNSDERGWFVEMLRKDKINKAIEQVSVASVEPGGVRGNHYHNNKEEWFMIINGKAQFCLLDSETGEKECFKLSGEKPQVVTVYPKVSHAIKNIDSQTIYFIEADSRVYNHDKPDAVNLRVI